MFSSPPYSKAHLVNHSPGGLFFAEMTLMAAAFIDREAVVAVTNNRNAAYKLAMIMPPRAISSVPTAMCRICW